MRRYKTRIAAAAIALAAIAGNTGLPATEAASASYQANHESVVRQVKPAPVGGTLIRSVEVLDPEYDGKWSIDRELAVGDAVFADRTTEQCAVSQLPAELAGAELILTPCDAKNSDKAQAAVTAAQDVTLYIAVDSRVADLPAWLSDFTKSDSTIGTSNDVTFLLYARPMQSGESMTLGANGQASGCMNYFAFAVKSGKAAADLNTDGTLDVLDVVLLQKWLLQVPGTALPDWEAGDLDKDGQLDVFDLALMKRRLTEGAQEPVDDDPEEPTEPVTSEEPTEPVTSEEPTDPPATEAPTVPPSERKFSFSVKNGLFDQNNTDTLGLSAPDGLETVTVWKASESGDHYCNGVCRQLTRASCTVSGRARRRMRIPPIPM